MSMHQPGPPGYPPPPGPQAPYPPPPGPPMPGPMPMPMPTPTPRTGERPGTAAFAGVALIVVAVLFVVAAVMEFIEIMPRGVPYSSVVNSRGIFLALMGIGAAGAGALAFANPDFGRVFAAAAAGAGIWEAAGWWREILMVVFDGNTGIYPDEFWIRVVPPVLGGFAGILALVMLATPKISDWSAAKRRS